MQAVFKNFDSVPHGTLIDKLISLNVTTTLISRISSYLNNRKQQAGVSGVNSVPFPQESATGFSSWAYALFDIHGLTSIPLSGGSLVLFDDDLLLHKVIHCIEDYLALQEDVDSSAIWISNHNLTFMDSPLRKFNHKGTWV